MTRPLRLEVPGGHFHVTARGNRKQDIFGDDTDRQRFLRVLAATGDRAGWQVLGYCLMPNHYHLVVRTPRPNLSRGMRDLNSAYAQSFNRRHDRPGHLFQGRYHSSLVQEERYLREVLRYVALNPVRAGLCGAAEDWPWGSHSAIAGVTAAPPFLRADLVLAAFGGRATYTEQVAAGDQRAGLRAIGAVVGDDDFAREHLPATRPCSEVRSADWTPGRPPLARLLSDDDEDAAIACAHRRFGYTLTAIATALDVHVATVSRRLRRFEDAARFDR